MQQPILEQLISDSTISQANLEFLWQTEMPLKTDETLLRTFLIDDRLYALSSNNYLISIDINSGKIIFAQTLGRPGVPVFELKQFDDQLYSIIANKLEQFDKNSGQLIAQKSFDFGVTCPAARNSEFFYIGGSDRRLHAYKAGNKVEVFKAAATSDTAVTYIVADEDFVIFSTEAGDLVGLQPQKPTQLWMPFKAADDIVVPVKKDGRILYFASKDTCVYCIDIQSGSLIWKYRGGAVYDQGPDVTKDIVYQYAGNRGLAAIKKTDGTLIWQNPQGRAFLSEDDSKTFLLTNAGQLAVMDNTNAKLLYSVDFFPVTICAANTADSRIYVADKKGRIACLKPLKR
jgi:outer membrane protein assembly factor BamB